MLNKMQLMTGIGTALTIIGTIGVATGQVTQEEWAGFSKTATDVASGVITLVGLAMTWWQTRKTAQVAAASQIAGVQIHVDTTPQSKAPKTVVKLAESDDPAAANVLPMGPVPENPQPVTKPNA